MFSKTFKEVPRSEIGSIEDVCDGQIYKDLFKSEFSQLFETNQIFKR